MEETLKKPGDMPTRLLATVAIILVLVVGGLTLQTSKSQRARDAAYQQITAAAAQNDYEALLQGVETFVANPSLLRGDERRQEVIRLGQQALVQWLAGQDDNLSTQALAQIERYRFLNADSQN